MIRDTRYILKRIIIGVAIGLILFYAKGLIAHAEVFNTTLKIDNTIVKANNWKSVGGTYGYYRVEYDGYPEGITSPNDYWYGSLVVCRDNASSGVDWNPSGVYSASTQLSVNNTNMPCFYPNSNYDGGKITIVNWKTSGGGSYNPVGFNLYQTGTSSVALLGIYINAQNWVDSNDFAGISSYAKQLEISNKITNIYNSIGTMTTSITNAIATTNQIAQETKNWAQAEAEAAAAQLDAMKDDNIDEDFQTNKINTIKNSGYNNNSISDIVLLPVTLINKVVDGLSSNSCSSFNLGSFYGTNIVLPCYSSSDISSWLGSTVYTIIDLFMSFGIILGIRKLVLKIYNTIIFLKEGGNTVD